ncbi:MAG: hypothetical protein FWE23_08415 [Chitinivibrionia bacterium]|jgi:methyl-accepting chemotaxis protein|nr:hypothetical protein [Chitinivibrionia bacterium]
MAKSKYKRENFLISKEIQGAYMVSFLIPMTIMLIVIALIFVFALRVGISQSIEKINSEVNTNLTIFGDRESRTVQDYRRAIENTRQALNENYSVANRTKNIDLLIMSMMYILIPGFLLAIVQIVFLTVFFSHKIAGPVFRLEIACKRVIGGDYKERVYLRDGDKMRDLATLFNEMTNITQERLEKALTLKTEEEKQTFRVENKLNP